MDAQRLLPVLEECVQLGCLQEGAATELRDAYFFLRDSEHAINPGLVAGVFCLCFDRVAKNRTGEQQGMT